MIGKLTGRLDYRAADHVMIDVRGVGYLVYCSDRTLAALPGVGEQMVLEQNVFLDGFMRHDGAGLSEEVMAEYNRPFPTPESRQIVLDWPREIPIGGSPENVRDIVQANSDFVAASTFPKLMFHVSPGAVIPMDAAEWIKANLTNIEAVYLGEGGHFIQEQYPDEIGKALADWLSRV